MPTRILDGVLNPDDLTLCKRVFDRACEDLNLDNQSLENEWIAMDVLALFQRGLHDENQLLAAVMSARQKPLP